MRNLLAPVTCGAALTLVSLGCAHEPPRPAQVDVNALSVRIEQTLRSVCAVAEASEPVFAFSSAQLSTTARQSLETLAFCLTEGPLKDRTLALTGRTDPTGSAEANRDLGFERAESVARFLEQRGVKRSHLVVSTRGELDASPDPERWPGERMVDLQLID